MATASAKASVSTDDLILMNDLRSIVQSTEMRTGRIVKTMSLNYDRGNYDVEVTYETDTNVPDPVG